MVQAGPAVLAGTLLALVYLGLAVGPYTRARWRRSRILDTEHKHHPDVTPGIRWVKTNKLTEYDLYSNLYVHVDEPSLSTILLWKSKEVNRIERGPERNMSSACV